jgi:hypothetical protein
MPHDFLLVQLIMSIWAVAMGAWVGAIERPFRFIETVRWAASFGFLTVALFVGNGIILC